MNIFPIRQKPGEPPCGECHLQPGETCDICGACAPADMRKPEDGGTASSWEADARLHEAAADAYKAMLEQAERDIAERDRRIADLEAGLKPFARIVDKDGEKIVLQWGENNYSHVLFPKHFYAASALLSGQQDTSDTHG